MAVISGKIFMSPGDDDLRPLKSDFHELGDKVRTLEFQLRDMRMMAKDDIGDILGKQKKLEIEASRGKATIKTFEGSKSKMSQEIAYLETQSEEAHLKLHALKKALLEEKDQLRFTKDNISETMKKVMVLQEYYQDVTLKVKSSIKTLDQLLGRPSFIAVKKDGYIKN